MIIDAELWQNYKRKNEGKRGPRPNHYERKSHWVLPDNWKPLVYTSPLLLWIFLLIWQGIRDGMPEIDMLGVLISLEILIVGVWYLVRFCSHRILPTWMQPVTVRKIGKARSKSEKNVRTLLAVFVLIVPCCLLILLYILNTKAILEDICYLSFPNRATGTVTLSDYQGPHTTNHLMKNFHTSHVTYDDVHFIITFDEETAGEYQYEHIGHYENNPVHPLGEKKLVFFKSLDFPYIIETQNFRLQHQILIAELILIVGIVVFRKKVVPCLLLPLSIADSLMDF